MQTVEIENVLHHYGKICDSIPLYPIRTEEEYEHAVQILNELLDAGGANENHPLARLVTLLGHFIGVYELVHYPIDESKH
jgi:antitoxin component HigA of HigAB toxin-antitoxin module